MSLLFNHGRRHDLCDRNPIQWVRQGAKRRTAPDILTSDEVQRLLASLRFRERTLVLLAVTTGLRRSELFALKWRDVDFQAKQIHVTRSIVQNVIGACKTESSQKPVPVHDDLLETLRQWHRHTSYQSPENWVFASPVNQGRGLTWRSRSCSTISFPLRESSASRSESAGILFGTPIRRCFDLRARN